MTYSVSGAVPQSLEELREFTVNELRRIEQTLQTMELIAPVHYKEPAHAVDGLLVHAKGGWIGASDGIYVRYNSAWTKLA